MTLKPNSITFYAMFDLQNIWKKRKEKENKKEKKMKENKKNRFKVNKLFLYIYLNSFYLMIFLFYIKLILKYIKF